MSNITSGSLVRSRSYKAIVLMVRSRSNIAPDSLVMSESVLRSLIKS